MDQQRAVATDAPPVRAGRSAAAGAALFAAAHGIGLLAARLQHHPTQLRARGGSWEAGSHVRYDAVLHASLGVPQQGVSLVRD